MPVVSSAIAYDPCKNLTQGIKDVFLSENKPASVFFFYTERPLILSSLY